MRKFKESFNNGILKSAALVLCMAMSLSLFGCGASEETTQVETTAATTTAATTTTVATTESTYEKSAEITEEIGESVDYTIYKIEPSIRITSGYATASANDHDDTDNNYVAVIYTDKE